MKFRLTIYLFVSTILYVYLAYFNERSNFPLLISSFGLLFLFYGLVAKDWNGTKKQLYTISFYIRLLLLFSIPELSDDFYRFLWDGTMAITGKNPYLVLPSAFMLPTSNFELQNLYMRMNSPNYYTVYPPINQLLFAIGGWAAQYGILWGVVVLRLPILLIDIALIRLMEKLLETLNMSTNLVVWYALNPLVVMELTGNLHYEGVMFFCLLFAIHCYLENRKVISAIFWAFAIGVKLIPLLFLPSILRLTENYSNSKASISDFRLRTSCLKYYFIVGVTTILLFSPFISIELLKNFWSSIDLYFQKFEFNASIYYLIRWLGYQWVGYNIIEQAGVFLAVISAVGILFVQLRKKIKRVNQWVSLMLFSLLIYYSCAMIVHPWYVINLLILGVLTGYRFPILWSGMVVLSYSAYSHPVYQENPWLVTIEYATVYSFALYEILSKRVNISDQYPVTL